MENALIETWQKTSSSLARLWQETGEQNLAYAQELYGNLAGKQWEKITGAVNELARNMESSENRAFDLSRLPFSMCIVSDQEIRSAKELTEIYHAAFERICDTQTSMAESYGALLSDYAANLGRSRKIDDVVATQFDFLSNLMTTVKDGSLDSLKVGESIKTALVAWSENSVKSSEGDSLALVD
ncbi:MAG: hypothetical protein ACU843_14705 [Gammaproteobacteria bacterium]